MIKIFSFQVSPERLEFHFSFVLKGCHEFIALFTGIFPAQNPAGGLKRRAILFLEINPVFCGIHS